MKNPVTKALTVPIFLALAGCSAGSATNGAQPGASPAKPAEQASVSANGSDANGAARQVPELSARVVLEPPGRDPVSVRVEVARTPAERQRGLMFRRSLDPDAGMLFIFEKSEQLTFWMRNTYISLDMIFIQPEMTVLGIVENAEPLNDSVRSVAGSSQYVLEVNAGFSRRHGLGTGTRVRFHGIAAPVPLAGE